MWDDDNIDYRIDRQREWLEEMREYNFKETADQWLSMMERVD